MRVRHGAMFHPSVSAASARVSQIRPAGSPWTTSHQRGPPFTARRPGRAAWASPVNRSGRPFRRRSESSFEQMPDNTQLSVSAWATRRQWGVNRTSRVTETRPSGTEFWRRSRPTPVSDPHAETTGSIKISCACEWLIEALNLASHQRMHPATPSRRTHKCSP